MRQLNNKQFDTKEGASASLSELSHPQLAPSVSQKDEIMNQLNRYKQNLRVTHEAVYSYETKVAEINHKNRTITPLSWWSMTTSKHINYVGSEYNYKVNKVKGGK